MFRTDRHTLSLVGAAALLAGAITACGAQVDGSPRTATPSAATNPAGQLSATGAPKLRFRPVLGSGPSAGTEKRQQTEPTKATTPKQLQQISDEKTSRQNALLLAMNDQTFPEVIQQHPCPATDLLTGHDDPELPLITCDQDNATTYVLGPAFLDNTRIVESTAERDSTGVGNIITVRFDDQGAKTWSDYTTANVQKQVALVFNTTVISAPTIIDPITGGTAQIAGTFTQPDAQHLADQIAGR